MGLEPVPPWAVPQSDPGSKEDLTWSHVSRFLSQARNLNHGVLCEESTALAWDLAQRFPQGRRTGRIGPAWEKVPEGVLGRQMGREEEGHSAGRERGSALRLLEEELSEGLDSSKYPCD